MMVQPPYATYEYEDEDINVRQVDILITPNSIEEKAPKQN